MTESVSLALRTIPSPDFADAVIVAIPASVGNLSTDPRWWAEQVFSAGSAPKWVVALLGLRQMLVGLIGVKRADRTVFDVTAVEGTEALIHARDNHLDFAAGVAIDVEHRLLTVTTAVHFNNWRGRLYFIPVSVLHAPVTRSMTKRAVASALADERGGHR
jgi:Protein of unknown function (DUF2867)